MKQSKYLHPSGIVVFVAILALSASACRGPAELTVADQVNRWPVHDESRPMAPKIEPGTFSSQRQPGEAPSDAVVLFDGSDLSQWESRDGSPAEWKVENGYFEVVRGTGEIRTKQGFGDVQLHIEWWTPPDSEDEGQGRNNSGVFFGGGRYEVQVLDSYSSKTYADGQASALYGQYPPLVNALRPAGEWQTYDIIFRAPRFDEDGDLERPARFTVFVNGVLAQDNVELTGPTGHHARPPYEAHPDRLPISLQDHGNPVRFRNIWVRELADAAE